MPTRAPRSSGLAASETPSVTAWNMGHSIEEVTTARHRFADTRERQRGWQKTSGSRDPQRFRWPAWGQPLDSNGIDALLDAWNP